VDGFRIGQPVAALLNDFGRGSRAGGYAEVAVARTGLVTAVPEGANLACVAAALVNGVTAWIALHRLARLQTSDDVVVLGASGGLGGTASRLAAIYPARRVIGVVGSDAKRRFVPGECTDVILAAQLGAALTEITDGRGVDVVIDPVGGQLRAQLYERLAPFGRLIVLDNASGQDQALSSDAAWHGTRHLAGLSLGGITHLGTAHISAAASTVVKLVHRGVLHEPDSTLRPVSQVSEIHRALENRCAPPKTVLALHDDT
jgi:NADPH2:quinone reductase